MDQGLDAIDRDLAFGLIAAGRGLVPPRALAEAMARRDLDPSRSLRDLLVEAGALTADRAGEVESRVDATLAGLLGAAPRALGRFRALRPHARGGLGEVLVAEDAELHREVALKEILPHLADRPDSRARFVVEAEITGGLEHPGIVPVYGLGHHADGRPYYAMRLVRGQTLLEATRKFHEPDGPAAAGPRARHRELRRLLTRFVAVCEAIAYAHSRGVVHRDLKPRNILLGRFGETLVVDWGSAKAVDDPDPDSTAPLERPIRPASGHVVEATIEGGAVGTPAYMPPEQADGRPDAARPAADVFGLGATLYHLLTGRPPFDAEATEAALRLARRADFPPPRAARPDVPAALEAICLRAMAAAPEDRYPSARALAEEVGRWLDDEPVLAHPEPPPARLGRWARRHQSRAFAAAAGLLLLASTVAVLSYRQKLAAVAEGVRREAREARWRGDRSRAEAARALDDAEARARLRDYHGRLDRAREARASGRVGWTAGALADLAGAPRLDDGAGRPRELRDQAIAALSAVDLVRGRALDPGIEATIAPSLAISPDGRRVAAFRHRPMGRLDYTGRVLDLDSGTPSHTLHFLARLSRAFDALEEVTDAAFSPDGRLLAAATSGGQVHLWDLGRPDAPQVAWVAAEKPLHSVAFTADGRSTATASEEGTLRLWRLGDDPTAGPPAEAASAPVHPLARIWRPGGTRELVAVRGRSMTWHDPETLREVRSVDLGPVPEKVEHACPSPDGRTVAFVAGGSVGLLPLGGGPPRMLDDGRIARRSDSVHLNLRFSPDGSLLMADFADYRGRERGVKLWEVGPGRLACSLPVAGSERVAATFTPDGRRVLVLEGRQVVEHAVNGLDVQPRLAHADAPIRAIAAAPDGSTLATLVRRPAGPGREGLEVALWKLPGGSPSAFRIDPDAPELDDPGDRHALAFDRYGRRLAVGTGGSRLLLWDLAEPGKPWAAVETGGIHPVFAFDDSGRTLWGILGRKGSDDRVAVVDPSRATIEDRWLDDQSKEQTGLHGLNDIAVAGGLVAVAALDGDLLLFRESDPPGAPPITWPGGGPILARDPAHAVALAPGAERVALGTQSGRLILRPVPAGQPPLIRDAHAAPLIALAFARDGRTLATGAADRALRLWSTDRGDLRLEATLPIPPAAVLALAFSPDGSRLFALLEGEHAVRAWDLARLRRRLGEIGLAW